MLPKKTMLSTTVSKGKPSLHAHNSILLWPISTDVPTASTPQPLTSVFL